MTDLDQSSFFRTFKITLGRQVRKCPFGSEQFTGMFEFFLANMIYNDLGLSIRRKIIDI